MVIKFIRIGKRGSSPVALGSSLFTGTSTKSRHKRNRKRKYHNIRRTKAHRVHKKRGRRYTPHTAGKRRDTSHRRIRQTKYGQPYIILASGKARFISKKSARISRKRPGGRY